MSYCIRAIFRGVDNAIKKSYYLNNCIFFHKHLRFSNLRIIYNLIYRCAIVVELKTRDIFNIT